jgi:hypothetical protein
MALALRCTSFEIIVAYSLNRDVAAIDYPNFQYPFIVSVRSFIDFFWVLKYLPWLTPMVANPSDWLISMMPKLAAIYEFRNDICKDVDKVLKNPELLEKAEHPTVYKHLLAVPEEKSADRELTREELMEEAVTLISAGTDTVGNTATTGLFHVLNNKTVLERLKSELHTIWPDPGVHVSYTNLEKLPYLVSKFNRGLSGRG